MIKNQKSILQINSTSLFSINRTFFNLYQLFTASYNHQTSMTSSTSSQENIQTYIRDPKMLNILAKKGISKLFPIQYLTYGMLYNGQDLVARDRTGSGKTLGYSLPIIMRMKEKRQFVTQLGQIKFLILLPVRELAIQVRQEICSLRENGSDFSVLAIYGGSGMQQQMQALRRGVDILIATPGRLIDFLGRKLIKLNILEVVCLDEADEMLNMGFKEDIEKIFMSIRSMQMKKTQNLLFSATIPDWIWSISNKYQSRDCKFIDLVKDSQVQTSKTVKHYKIYNEKYEREKTLSPLLSYFTRESIKKAIIFCETKRQVQRLASQISIPLRTEALHGDVMQNIRQKIYREFKYGNLQCIIATDVAARGLDFPEISLIIQMQPPKNSQSYLHRSGRTGRAGSYGVCVTFYSGENEHFLGRILRQLKIQMEQINSNQIQKYRCAISQKVQHQKQQRFSNWQTEQRNNFLKKQIPQLQKNSVLVHFEENQYQPKEVSHIAQNFQAILPKNILEPERIFFDNPGDLSVIQTACQKSNQNKMSFEDYRINKTLACHPIGIKCWPCISLYVLTTKISLYLSRICDHKCHILFFPYKDYSLSLYPSNLITQSPFDYKKKLKLKNKPMHEIYFQKCIGIPNFEALAFTKIESQRPIEMKSIIQDLLKSGKKLNKSLNSILIPYIEEQLGGLQQILEGIINGLQEGNNKYSEVIISTNDICSFLHGSEIFLSLINKLVENNEIVIV